MWIEKLAPQQESLVTIYREKWIKVAFSTEAIDIKKAGEAVIALYQLLNFPETQIYFAISPYQLLNRVVDCIDLPHKELATSDSWKQFTNQLKEILGYPLWMEIRNKIYRVIESRVKEQVEEKLLSQIDEWLKDPRPGEKPGLFRHEPMNSLYHKVRSHLSDTIKSKNSLFKFLPDEFLQREFAIEAAKSLDFCISVLGCDVDRKMWGIFSSVLTECGWIYPLEKACFVSDRPIAISLDAAGLLHAEGKPAIEFADGYSIYASHGSIIG